MMTAGRSDARPIGVFDSGVGGLTVARAIMRELPREELVYLGDTARLPYGTKSAGTVLRFARQNASYLRGVGVKMVVVACHSASACALPDLVPESEIPMIGVTVPGSRAATQRSRAGRIGVIGTRATIGSDAFQREILRLRPEARVTARACPLFVPLVEEGWEDSTVAREIARHYLEPLLAERIDCLVLGCTHYPVLRPLLQEVVGDEIVLVDPGEETAREVAAALADAGLARGSASEPKHRFVVTDYTPRMRELTKSFLGREVTEVQTLPLEALEEMERSH